ncbi:glycosyltransferase [Candidatus Pacearchaeota archaeon]|nr:glycosyltransferase [Candidatus Pacearchaeota archaeon]
MKISIITVCYNSNNTIEDTIKSVVGQSYNNIEYIVIDGGSTDGTIDILKKYKDFISRQISEPDAGIYDAMNKGVMFASGDVIGFLNADDYYADNNIIEKVADVMKNNEVDCCYGDLEYIAPDNLRQTVRRWKSQPYQDGLFKDGWHPPHPTFFTKKTIFDMYGGFDIGYNIGADYELMLRFLKKHSIKSCYIPSVLVVMRAGGKSNKNLWQIIKANIECFQAWKKNDLKVSPLIILKKPLSKIAQLKNEKN